MFQSKALEVTVTLKMLMHNDAALILLIHSILLRLLRSGQRKVVQRLILVEIQRCTTLCLNNENQASQNGVII